MNLLLNVRISNQNLITTIRRIEELKYREEVELLPTPYARNMAIALIQDAAKYRPNYFFAPWLSGDEFGGVRVVWARCFDAQVRLLIPTSIDTPLAIYRHCGDSCNLEYNVSGKILSEYIEWLCKLNGNTPTLAKLGSTTREKNALF